MTETNFCCHDMETNIKINQTIIYSEVFDEYGILFKEDGVSYIEIAFCPWCGKKLPLSKRDEWFDRLEKMGYTLPFSQDGIPDEYKSAAWRLKL